MIRALQLEDLDVLYELRQEALIRCPASFGSTPEYESKEWMADRMRENSEEDFVLGYFIDHRLVGLVGMKRERQEKKRHKAWIWGLYVSRDYRNRHIGRKLLEACIDKSRSIHGLKAIVLSVTDASDRARKLYENLGFERWGIETNALFVDDSYYDEIHLKRSF